MTYVFIPGAGGDGSYSHLVAAELRRRGHETIAVDLPADDDGADIPDYADVVVEAIGDRRDVILVAQSMGGFTAPLVCEHVPVRMIVLLNAMIPAPGERPGDWWTNTGQAAARREKDRRDGRDPDADFDVATVFLHDVPRDVVEQGARRARPQSNTPFTSSWTPPSWPDIPTRVLIGRDDRFFPAEFQRRVAQERLRITPDEIAGGHLAALSHPLELADQLEAYLAELDRGGS
jgi:pimeloyl-ACP methyl ester carboxylesterase